VAVTVRLKSAFALAGGVTARPTSCDGASVQVPSGFAVPADRTAPAGTPEIRIDRLSEPSASARDGLIASAIAVSSLPLAAPVARFGASAIASTVTGSVAVVDAVEPPSASVVVAVTVSVKSASLFAGGVSARPASCAGVSVQVPSAFLTPADRLALDGTPEIRIDRLSEPSVSTRDASIDSAIALSSLPLAGLVARFGASATAFTVTGRVAVVDAVEPPSPSVVVAVTVSVKSASLFDGAVSVRPDSCAAVSVQVPSAFFTPAERLAVEGTPEMRIDRLSEPSVSTREALIDSAIALSSFPFAALVARFGASTTGATVTGSVATVEAVEPPMPSVVVAVTVSVKSASLFAGGVRASPDSCAGASVQLPSAFAVPAESVAPAGMPVIRTDRVSDPSVSTRPAEIDSAIAPSSAPEAALVESVGASATASTVITKSSAGPASGATPPSCE
jgi:hypothetical protein